MKFIINQVLLLNMIESKPELKQDDFTMQAVQQYIGDSDTLAGHLYEYVTV